MRECAPAMYCPRIQPIGYFLGTHDHKCHRIHTHTHTHKRQHRTYTPGIRFETQTKCPQVDRCHTAERGSGGRELVMQVEFPTTVGLLGLGEILDVRRQLNHPPAQNGELHFHTNTVHARVIDMKYLIGVR